MKYKAQHLHRITQTLLHTNTQNLLGGGRTPHQDGERLIISSTTVWMRSQLMFRLSTNQRVNLAI